MYRIGFSQIIRIQNFKKSDGHLPLFPIKVSEFSNDGVSMG
jgi:hypothetical protein